MANLEDDIKDKLQASLEVHANLGQHALVVLEDKVRLILADYEKQFKSVTDWLSLLSLWATLIVAILTAQFEDFYFISASVIKDGFWLAALYITYRVIRNVLLYWKRKPITIEDVIQQLRDSSEQK